MMVAWHEVPGNGSDWIRPVGNGMSPSSLRSNEFEDDDEDENEVPYFLTARINDELCRFHW